MTTKIAIIGCGQIANNAHLPAIAGISDVSIKYTVDLIKERAENAKAKYGALIAETDYKVALADKEVSAVYILTPNYSHYQITIDALNAGKHVFCEKPITVNYKMSKIMQQCANDRGLILNIGVCNRFHRSVELIKELKDNGELGDIYHVYCSFRSYRDIPGLGGAFTYKELSGGGVLIDWGVHFLDLIMYVTGVKVKAVSAQCYSKLGKNIEDYNYVNMWAGPPNKSGINDVEEFVTGLVRTDGATISLNGAWAQNINKREMFIDFLGDKGGVRLEYGEKFTLYNQSGELLQEITPNYNIPNMYEAEDKAFFNSIKTGVKNKSHIDYVIETAKIMDSIYVSSQEGKEVLI